MRTLSELRNVPDPAWNLLEDWIARSPRPVEVLPRDSERADRVLASLQVTTRSSLGAMADSTGGLLLDSGWLRMLGHGDPRIHGDLLSWNPELLEGAPPERLIVAHDVLGGLFALDASSRHALYFAPGTLRWDDLELGYTEFLEWALLGAVDAFYESLRWTGWRDEVARLPAGRALSVFPPPWSSEGKDLDRCSRAPVPLEELLALQRDVATQLGG